MTPSALRDHIALDLREQGEHRCHDLDLNVALFFEPDVLLDRYEDDTGPGVEHGDDFTERSAEAGQFAYYKAVAGLLSATMSSSSRRRAWRRCGTTLWLR